ncbi:ABC transporter ATP-binding protein [Achromobacter aloeverae]|uniref:Glutathione import ATP-binding protein GsiA n=1 Tax=Achromobacter aloeverae TaxID=1750518 RepID=A0A4Q1HP21_9BURK|nr:dipeptide ABC transporter ATP-binding protein [Achromobacter aloeverae]RXN91605.1 ABC transporter ATP-binding protein [Achromobacter aloeverae]
MNPLNTHAPGKRVLTIDRLSVDFGSIQKPVHAVRGLSLHVDRGETLAIVGESGSGKSVTSLTTMRLVEFGGGRVAAGAIEFQRTKGAVDLLKLSESEMRSIRGSEIAMIFQEPMTSLNPVLTVGQQITEAIRLHQKSDARTTLESARHILDQVRIPDARGILERYPHELSGGMRQRVMIAMALSCRPSLLIADEPTTALDVTIQAQILQLIRELQKEMDMAVIFITHDMGVVAEVADRVMVMRHGEVVEENAVEPLFAHPVHPYTRALLAAVPRLGDMRGTAAPAHFALLDKGAAPTTGRKTQDSASKGDGRIILRVKDLVTRFDVRGGFLARVRKRVHAVEHLSFELKAGETLALVGESGCGKTTTGRSLMRLAKPLSGTVEFDGHRIDGKDPASLTHLRRNMQFIFQDPFASLNPRMRIGASIKEPMLIHGIAQGQEADRRVAALLERVGLSAAMADRWPHEFSGGQRQRICIARALSVNPKVLIADESVSALDVSIQAQIVNLLIDLQQEFGMAYLFISHDMAVVERISHRVAVMYLGQIVEIGPRQSIFENPQHPYTRKLMQAVPIADPTQRRTRTLEVSEIPSPVRPIGYRPDIAPLVKVGPGHFVAHHKVGA